MRPSGPRWRLTPFGELSAAEWHRILTVRAEVFVVEQACAYCDPDKHDTQALHLLGEQDGALAAYLRILPPGEKWPEAALGRILTTARFRGVGLGREVVAEGIRQARHLFPGTGIRIGAQAHLERFYREFGFVPCSPLYDEDGIPHLEMLLIH